MKTNQQRKTDVVEAEKEAPEAERPVWFLGKQLKITPAKQEETASEAKAEEAEPKKVKKAEKSEKPEQPEKAQKAEKTEKTQKAEKTEKPQKAEKSEKPHKAEKAQKAEKVEEPEADSDEGRPSQLEAYMRYAKMRQPSAEQDDALAPVGTSKFPTSRYTAGNENDIDWADEAPRKRRPRHKASYGFRLRDAALAGVASIAIGALAGAVVYDRTNDGELSSALFNSIGGFMTGFDSPDKAIADAGQAGVSVSEDQGTAVKKPVSTARLDVSDAKGDVNSPIPLNISAEPAAPDQDIGFRLSGLPADAYLSAGTKLADNAWVLKPGEQLGVKLMVPKAPASPLLIAVEAIEQRTGDLAAPAEEMKVALASPAPAPAPAVVQPPQPAVQPVSAPPTDIKRNFNLPPATQQQTVAAAQPIPAPIENDDTATSADSDSLMLNGDKLLSLGDFTAARAFFSKARDLGVHEASLRLGQTYDPIVFRDKNVQGLKPDPAMALKYYLEARTAGISDAETAIAGLETWMKQ